MAYNRGIYGEAHEFYTQALNYLGDGIGLNNKAAIFNNLGTIFKAYGDTVSARIHYIKALKLTNQTKNIEYPSFF